MLSSFYFDLSAFEFLSDDGIRKTFRYMDNKIIFEKSWFSLMPEDTENEVSAGVSEPLETLYHDLSPNITLKTTINISNKKTHIEENIIGYSLKESNNLYNKLNIQICATIYVGLVTLKNDK